MGNCSSGNDTDDGETCIVDIYMTDVTDEFPSMRKVYTCDGNCFVLLYSVTDSNSLLELESTYRYIQTVKQQLKPPTILVGNKTDLADDRQVTTDEGNALATKLDIPFVETSAKTGENVQKLFETLICRTPRSSMHYKVVVFGSRGVGRYCICDRYVNNWYLTGYSQICGADFRKGVIVKDIPEEMKKIGKQKRKTRIFPGKPKHR